MNNEDFPFVFLSERESSEGILHLVRITKIYSIIPGLPGFVTTVCGEKKLQSNSLILYNRYKFSYSLCLECKKDKEYIILNLQEVI